MQGNCSDPDAAAALGLSPAEAAALLPLKPRQCLLLVPKSLLAIGPDLFWVDNLYLKVARMKPVPGFTLLSTGYPFEAWVKDLYVTNVTMHGEARGMATAVRVGRSRLFMKGAQQICS